MKKLSFSLLVTLTLATLLLGGMLLGMSGTAQAAPQAHMPSPVAPDHTSVISDAFEYLETRQAPDGGLMGWSAGADEFTTIKGVLALAAARLPQNTLAHSTTGKLMVDFLAARATTYTRDITGTLFPGRVGMLVVAASAANAAPSNFGGVNLVTGLESTYHPATGAYSSTAKSGFTTGMAGTVNQVWAILGLAAAQAPIPANAVDFLLTLQETDGGWGYGFGGDTDITGLTLQALMASGHITPTHPAILKAVDFLKLQQDAMGSWGYVSGDAYVASPDSTASVIQGLVALGHTPATDLWSVGVNKNPHTALVAMQTANGSFASNALGTAHAIAGLSEAPLPILGRAQRARLALTTLADAQQPDGAWLSWGAPSAGATADAVLAFASAGYDPKTVHTQGGVSPLDYLSKTAATYTAVGPDTAGKLTLAVIAAGLDPQDFGGLNLIDTVNGYYDATEGAFDEPSNVWHQSFAILALKAVSATIPTSTTETLCDLQQENGGWGYDATWNLTTVDHTSLAIQALTAAGMSPSTECLIKARAFLQTSHNTQGGWENANSTAFAIQGLTALGEDLASDAWKKMGHTPFNALMAYQKPDGPFVFDLSALIDDEYATRQAVPALLAQTLPISETLEAWDTAVRGPDPDRLVVGTPRYNAETGTLVFPFGSDLNANATVTGTWLLEGSMAAVPFTLKRGTGRFTATLSLSNTQAYAVSVYISDVDGVQGKPMQMLQITAGAKVFLPVVLRLGG